MVEGDPRGGERLSVRSGEEVAHLIAARLLDPAGIPVTVVDGIGERLDERTAQHPGIDRNDRPDRTRRHHGARGDGHPTACGEVTRREVRLAVPVFALPAGVPGQPFELLPRHRTMTASHPGFSVPPAMRSRITSARKPSFLSLTPMIQQYITL